MNEKELLISCITEPRYPVTTLMHKYGFSMYELQQLKADAALLQTSK